MKAGSERDGDESMRSTTVRPEEMGMSPRGQEQREENGLSQDGEIAGKEEGKEVW